MLDAIQVFDVVPPAVLPEQLVAEAQRIAKVPVALYVLDIDGTHLLHLAGPDRLGAMIEAPLAIGPELDADGLSQLRDHLASFPGAEVHALWLRGRANGVMIAFGHPAAPLTELTRQAAAAITLADRYTDAFAAAQRRKQPKAAAEIQQSLLPPRIMRVTGGEIAGNVLPSYEVAGDWYDVVENGDGIWVTLADGLGGSTRAAASSAVALGGLRASRRSGAGISEALVVMHQALRELPGPHAEMTAVAAIWDPAGHDLTVANCAHVPPVILRGGRGGRGPRRALGARPGRPGQRQARRAVDHPGAGRSPRDGLGRSDQARRGQGRPRHRRRDRGGAALRAGDGGRHRSRDSPSGARRRRGGAQRRRHRRVPVGAVTRKA